MYFDTAEEYTAEIALAQSSIRKTMESQKYGTSSNGNARESQRVELPALRIYLKELITERDIIIGGDSAPINRIFAKNGRRY